MEGHTSEFYTPMFPPLAHFISETGHLPLPPSPAGCLQLETAAGPCGERLPAVHSQPGTRGLGPTGAGFYLQHKKTKGEQLLKVVCLFVCFCKPICQHAEILILGVIKSINDFDLFFLTRGCT